MATKIIKGQAWIQGDKLLQNQELITETGTSSNVVALIDNIWDDLLDEKGKYKYNAKKTFFYWEYQQTDLDGESEVTVMIGCPKPKEGLFREPYDPSSTNSEWAKYWLTKYKETAENFERTGTIQPKKIIFPETEYVNTNGEVVKVEKREVEREDLGDVTNLLLSF